MKSVMENTLDQQNSEENIRISNGEVLVKLKTGLWIYNYYGSLAPKITFLIPDNMLMERDKPLIWDTVNRTTVFKNPNISIPEHAIVMRLKGTFFVSKKKGTKCFKLSRKGPHSLYKIYIPENCPNIKTIIGYVDNKSRYTKVWSTSNFSTFEKIIYAVI